MHQYIPILAIDKEEYVDEETAFEILSSKFGADYCTIVEETPIINGLDLFDNNDGTYSLKESAVTSLRKEVLNKTKDVVKKADTTDNVWDALRYELRHGVYWDVPVIAVAGDYLDIDYATSFRPSGDRYHYIGYIDMHF